MPTKQLSNGKAFSYSEEDRVIVLCYGWCYSNGYVVARKPGHNTTIRFHREVLKCPADLHVDHIDGNPLNNCRDNLRITTRSGNMRNSAAKNVAGRTSNYKGVSLCKATNRWKAQITLLGTTTNLGRFDTELEAATAYDRAALLHYKDFAYTNGVFKA